MMNEFEERINFELAMYSDKTESIDNIIDNIYVGNYPAALNITLLKSLGITHILTAVKDRVDMFNKEIICKYFHFMILHIQTFQNTSQNQMTLLKKEIQTVKYLYIAVQGFQEAFH